MPSDSDLQTQGMCGAALQIELDGHGVDELHVLSFDGREEMNGLYAFDVTFWGRDLDEGAFARATLGHVGSLCLQSEGNGARTVHGIVSSVVLEGKQEADRCVFRATLVPRLWLLTRRWNNKIFQDLSVPQIVDVVLEEHGIARSWALLSDYPSRSYCLQYDESDYQFITRILAEDGIFFCFEQRQGDPSERLVFGDRASAYAAIAGDAQLSFHPQRGSTAMPAAEHHVLDLRESIQIEPNVVVTHDYDFLRPKLDLTSRAAITDPAVPLEVYADCRYEEGRDGGRNSASVILAQLRSGVRMFDGVSVCKRLVPGHWFTLTDRDAAAGDGDYVITVVEHRGVVAESIQAGKRTYENRFRCAPRDVAYRPPRPRRALQQVTESAVVVGPAGQEIHTDPYGRVKVQFHWDRDGRRNEHSSCWMRVMQPWAGAGWGAQFIPRVGMEVVVSFLGGDVDRPVVMGALYNAANLPPLRLGEKMTQSGIRTQSTPGGGGYNQILFEDSAGGELVAIRAQRNLEEAAMNDLRSTAGRDQAITVGRNASRDVEADDVLHVKGSQTVRVDGALVSQTGGSSSADCSGDRHARVGGDDTVDAGGGHTLQAATFSHVLVGHGNEDGGHGLVLVNGNYRVAAAGELLLSAQQSIRISCGESEILLTPTGVKISAPSVELAVGEKLTCSGKENTITIDDHIEIKGDLVKILAAKASVVLEEEAIVRGAKIKLTSGESTPPPDESDDSPDLGDVIFHLDPSFDPGAKGPLTAIIATPTGEVIEKVADANNDVKVQGRKGDHFVLLGVRCGETTLAKKPA